MEVDDPDELEGKEEEVEPLEPTPSMPALSMAAGFEPHLAGALDLDPEEEEPLLPESDFVPPPQGGHYYFAAGDFDPQLPPQPEAKYNIMPFVVALFLFTWAGLAGGS